MAGTQFTLVGDGSSDRILVHPIRWVLQHLAPNLAFQGEWADLSRLRKRPRNLKERVDLACRLFPCDIFFVHRDAENATPESRISEIQEAVAILAGVPFASHVCVIPVRMTEAWFLFNEEAIRMAAGNPNGNEPLELPRLAEVEHLHDPKDILHKQLETASGLAKRRLSNFRPQERVHRLAQLITDFSPLKALGAFSQLIHQTKSVLDSLNSDK